MNDTLGTVAKWQDTVIAFFIQYGIRICGALIILGIGMFLARWVGRITPPWPDKTCNARPAPPMLQPLPA